MATANAARSLDGNAMSFSLQSSRRFADNNEPPEDCPFPGGKFLRRTFCDTFVHDHFNIHSLINIASQGRLIADCWMAGSVSSRYKDTPHRHVGGIAKKVRHGSSAIITEL